MEIIAHRGNKRYTPENTMAAFMSAATSGADGIELDVQWTKDGVPVVFHDEKIDRTTNGSGWLRDFTYKELRQFDAGSWFNSSFFGEKVPALEDVLDWLQEQPQLTLHLEVKKPPRDFQYNLEQTFELLRSYSMTGRTVVSTFYHPLLTYMAKEGSESGIERALLTKTPLFRGTRYAGTIMANAIHIRHSLQAVSFYPLWARAGIPVRAYKVNRVREALRCRRLNVTGIITDDPKAMVEALKR
ncbi:glycerophosphodiester phosphodiesterase family protein [Alteribacter natronophilus]|uniref:glycerophosphodiester phosphodiesterase family protein n=1 Tax=Alteribacter natronophilus TaxID=2583810 RepID=UPI00110E2301|nr:glycerophosphodiester phosphodiesterase family protein [Alteribacter natronophilus]TMW73842.1 glycerophosphodiester phosphodiesterase [Alteribacter natronophilus]